MILIEDHSQYYLKLFIQEFHLINIAFNTFNIYSERVES